MFGQPRAQGRLASEQLFSAITRAPVKGMLTGAVPARAHRECVLPAGHVGLELGCRVGQLRPQGVDRMRTRGVVKILARGAGRVLGGVGGVGAAQRRLGTASLACPEWLVTSLAVWRWGLTRTTFQTMPSFSSAVMSRPVGSARRSRGASPW